MRAFRLLRLALIGFVSRWKSSLPFIVIMSLSLFFIIYETTIFGIALTRTYSLITLFPHADVWVMDQKRTTLSDHYSLNQRDFTNIKALPGVVSATPLLFTESILSTKGKQAIKTNLIAIEGSSEWSLPLGLSKGKLQNLAFEGGVFIDQVTGKSRHLRLGSKLNAGNQELTVVGAFSLPKGLRQMPFTITSVDTMKKIEQGQYTGFPFILVKKSVSTSSKQLKALIEKKTGLKAFEKDELIELLLASAMRSTGLPSAFGSIILFGALLAVGIIVGTLLSLSGQGTPSLSLYKRLGASDLSLMMISCIELLLSVGAAFLLVICYYLILLGSIPFGAQLFLPDFQILLATLGVALLSTLIVSLVNAWAIQEVGGQRI